MDLTKETEAWALTATRSRPMTAVRLSTAVAVAACAAVGVLAVVLGLPGPGPDDLFYSGAAIELARGGGLRNPLLDGQHFLSRDFLIYPAFYQYLLAGWLKVAGLGTRSLLVFQQIWYVAAGVCLHRLLSWYGVVPRRFWFAPALFTIGLLASLGTAGLRPDICGFALMLGGFVLRTRRSRWAKAMGWLLVLGSVGITPNVLPYIGLALFLVALHEPARATLKAEWPGVVAAALVCAALFAWSISGRFGEFERAFVHHAHRAVAPFGEAILKGFARCWRAREERLYYVVAVAITAALAVIPVVRRRLPPRPRRRVVLTMVAVLAVLVGSTAMTWIRSEHRLMMVVLWVEAVVFWLAATGRFRVLALTGALGLIVALGRQAATASTRYAPAAATPPAQLAAIRAAVAREPNRRYLVDAAAAREVFDFHLPPNARDWFFSQPFPDMWPTSFRALRADESWIVSGRNLRLIEPAPWSDFVPAFRFRGRSIRYYRRDYQVELLDGRKNLGTAPP